MDLISSRNNPKIKRVRALKQRKGRQESGLFTVEGIFHVGEAVAASDTGKVNLDAIYYAPDLLKSDFAKGLIHRQVELGVSSYATTAAVFESIAEKENPQGILAVVRFKVYTLAELSPGNLPWGIALIAPQDPGNVGAIMRTIDAVGANGLLLLDNSVDPFHPSVVRSSMGALFWYPVVRTTFEELIDWTSQHGYHIYGTSVQRGIDYREVGVYHHPLILLMGSEREGLTYEQAAICEKVVRIPMQGRVTSLNLAVATGVISYAILEKLKGYGLS
jgi:TrmH family RNA methyltransferase